MKKRLFGILVVLVMVMCLAPTTVFADSYNCNKHGISWTVKEKDQLYKELSATHHKVLHDYGAWPCKYNQIATEEHTWNNGVCSKCNYVCKHTGGTATCTEQATCTYCGLKYGDKKPNNHTGEAEWVKTATTHKKVYSCCGAVEVGETAHTWDNGKCSVCTYVCNHDGEETEWEKIDDVNHKEVYKTCGGVKTESAPHDWDKETGKCKVCEYECQHVDDDKNHYCDTCEYKMSDHEGGTAYCNKYKVCTYCNKEYGEYDPKNHSGKAEWVETETPAATHKKVWNCCDVVEVEEASHDWDKETGKCKVCEYECQHVDDDKNHYCDTCGYKMSDHEGGTATCKSKAICTYCGQEYGSIAPNEHTGAEEWVKTPTTHKKWWNCCKKVTVEETDHDWSNGDGKCSVCEYTCDHTNEGTEFVQIDNATHKEVYKTCKSVKTASLPHVWENGVCKDCDAEHNHDGEKTVWNQTADTHEKVYETCRGVVESATAHTWDKGKCSVCDYECNHDGEKTVWNQTATTHEKVYETCKGVVEPATAHTWDKGKCSVCGYECTHEGEDTEWVITPDTHEKVYKTCREVVEPATAHTGGEATCTEQATCKFCEVKYGPLKPHTLKHEDAKAATLTTYGNKEYWFCTVCSKYFGDEDATNEVKLSDIVIAKLAPTIIAGDGQTVVVSGKTALTFTSNAAFEDFIRVELDGKTVDSNNYTVASGSTVVTLNAEYVATLAAGDHTLGIVSQGGTATAKFTVTKKATESTTTTVKAKTKTTTVKAETTGTTTSAKTGDNSNLGLWIALLCVSGGAVTATTIVNRRKKCNR